MRKKPAHGVGVRRYPETHISLMALLTAALVLIWGLAAAQARQVPQSFTALAKAARPGVVNIRTVKRVTGQGPLQRYFPKGPWGQRNPFEEFFGPFFDDRPGREFKQRSLGSGFIINRKGYIVTNHHVIEGADQIQVKLADGREFDAEIKGRDTNTDLALIKIDAPADLKPLKLGDSDRLEVGTWVVAVGSPFGLEQTVTAGIVSAKGRIIGSGPYDDFIQTDASINPGNSGGPLLNMAGEVVGINTAVVARGQGIGFAIPANLAKGIIAQLQDNGEVTRGWLGVAIQNLTPDLAEYYGLERGRGVLITQVYEGDPADRAGLRPNDVILSVDGNPVAGAQDLTALIAAKPVGRTVEIKILRKEREKTFRVKLSRREENLSAKAPAATPGQPLPGGIEVQDLSAELADQLGISESESGVLVTRVKPGSAARRAGLQKGDLIKEVNHQPVESAREFERLMERRDSRETTRLLVLRPESGYWVITLDP